jgi:hypothetical protein
LVEIENTWLGAVKQNDTATPVGILAEEFEAADSAGSLISRSEILASAENRGDVYYQLSEMHAHVDGDFAYVRGLGAASERGQPRVKLRSTDIFPYRAGRWQCTGHASHFPNS